MKADNTPKWVQINQAVEAYESARGQSEVIDIDDFLPKKNDPLYIEVLTELIRVQMDYQCPTELQPAEYYLDRYPELRESPQAVQALQEEAVRQKNQKLSLQSVPEPDINGQIGSELQSPSVVPASSAAESDVLLSEFNDSSPTRPARKNANNRLAFPSVGDHICGFSLLGEIGRGSFSRVFLAKDERLSERPVVLKIIQAKFNESQTLALLQHTNIVPIYSVHRYRSFEVICMPFFGSLTFHHLLQHFATDSLPCSAANFMTTVRHEATKLTEGISHSGDSSLSDHSSNLQHSQVAQAITLPKSEIQPAQELEGRSYVDAVVWLGARLAQGLAHAHGRGVLHLDLKPANILVTDDGQPMLLDFNLAQDVSGKVAPPERIGGTFPYMSVEHLQAFLNGKGSVDGRADTFGLGVILYQMLSGKMPYAGSSIRTDSDIAKMIDIKKNARPISLRKHNPLVSPAVDAIIQRCLAPDLDERYQDIQQVADDLQRQFEHRPLRHTREPSIVESLAKWKVRHPKICSATTMAVLAGVVLLAVLYGFFLRGIALARMETQQAWQSFADQFQSVKYQLNIPNPSSKQLGDGIALCENNLATVKPIAESPGKVIPNWLPEDQRNHLQSTWGEHWYLLVHGYLQLAKMNATEVPSADQLLQWNQKAEDALGDRPIITKQRIAILTLAGRAEEANRLKKALQELPSDDTPQGLYLQAAELIVQGKPQQAGPLLDKLLVIEPGNFWGWMARGYKESALGNHHQAVAAFSTALALRPEQPWSYHLRGLSYMQTSEYAKAERDFSSAIQRNSQWWEPYFSRGICYSRQQDLVRATSDMDRALDVGGPSVRILFMKSRLLSLQGKNDQAKESLNRGLQATPEDELDWVALGLAYNAEPAKALHAFDKALSLNPSCLSALQNKGHLLAEVKKDAKSAVSVMEKVVESYPDYLPGRGGLAILLARVGERTKAIQQVNECLARRPSAEILYQLAGVFAQTSRMQPADADRAIELLTTALQNNWGHQYIRTDADLNPIRNLPAFKNLVAKYLRSRTP